MNDRYPVEELDSDYDDGTMVENKKTLEDAVVGRRIVSAEKGEIDAEYYPSRKTQGLIITLDNGFKVTLEDSNDCCAYTDLESFLLHPEMVDHIITGVGTEDGYQKWHIYADMGDVLDLEVGWSSGNPFYYGYGFHINVIPLVIQGEVVKKELDA